MDRHLMTAPPVFADGRVFLTGEHDVIAFDAYNGRELWCTRIPDVGRKYAQYYSSNLVADDTSAFVATKDTCLRLDRETGNVLRAYAIPDPVVKDTPAQTTGNYMSVDWPITWHVAGPFPKGSPLPAADQLTALPKRLTLGETVCETRPLNAVDGRLDFTVLFGAPGLKPPKEQSAADSLPRQMPKPLVHWAGQVAVAYAEIVCDRPGTLMVGAGADWWMSWTLDGKPVFDTLKGGNEPSRHTYWSRTTCTDTDYLFPVDVEAGRHVIAVVVKSGSRGWSLASASQGAAVATVMPVVTGDDNVPNLRDLVWGYLSVVDDLVLGTYAVPVAAGQDAESQLIARSESKALFALDKASGSLRWVVRPRPGRTFSNIEIAFGDGRIFALDATSKADSVRALRRGETPEVAISLAAFDLASGAELWRQDDVPVLRDRSMPTRLKSNPTHLFMGLPNWGHLMYADGVVLLAANAAYDAETGEKLWENTVRPQKLPVVLDNWVISHPYAYRLHTGEQRMDTDQLTGETVPWRYDRAYGCGPINGCRNLLFFRSGTDGFYDVHTGGTTNFGGVRPSCGRSLIAAGGMMIHPEGYSGCCCSYNYQTSLALVPAPTTKSTWYVYPRRSSTGLIRRIALNFGAPGDRSAADGTAWLGYPRPMIGNACPAPARLQLENAQCIIKGGAGTQTATRDAPWVYSSALAGEGRITLGLTLTTDAAIPSLPETPNIDGNLDDRAWDNAAALPFETTPLNVMGAGIDFQAGISSDALCFRYARGSIAGTAQDRTPTGDAAGAEDIQIYVTDLRRKTGIRIGVARDGTRFATLGNVDRYRKVQPGWQATWSAAVRENGDRWEAEIALPLPVLEDAGINPRKLQINAMSRNRTDAGLAPAFLTDPLYGADFRRCVRFVRIAQNPRELPPERRFTVTLHFAEVDEKAGPGDRVFTVALQGTPVLSNLDIAGRTGGANRPFVHAVPGVRAGDAITVELTPEHGGTSRLPPLINGLDIVEETN
jgi:outer membrane protein assembly factor BamB